MMIESKGDCLFSLLQQIAAVTLAMICVHVSAQPDQERALLIEIESLAAERDHGLFSQQVYFTFHDGSFDPFDQGKPASEGLAWFASEGSFDQLLAELRSAPESMNQVAWVTVGQSWNANNAFGFPVASTAVVFPSSNQFVSVIGRIYPSDDAFFGNDDPRRYRLYDNEGNFAGPVVIELHGSDILDAGTRLNDEVDLQGLDRRVSEQINPDLRTEELPVRPHPGFNGSVRSPAASPVRLLASTNEFCAGDVGGACLRYDPAQIDFTRPGYPIARIRISEYLHGGYSGSYFDSERAGEGFSFSIIDTDPRQILFYWFTYSDEGNGDQKWLIGQGDVPSASHPFELAEIYSTSGGRLGALSNPELVDLAYWGSAFIGFGGRQNGPACIALSLNNIQTEDPDVVLALPKIPAVSGPFYDIARLGPLLTGGGNQCGQASFPVLSVFP